LQPMEISAPNAPQPPADLAGAPGAPQPSTDAGQGAAADSRSAADAQSATDPNTTADANAAADPNSATDPNATVDSHAATDPNSAEADAAPPALPIDAPLTADWQAGQIHLLGPLAVPGLPARLVRVYLPSTYAPGKPHFGLYMFDGQNVFDDGPSFAGGWHLHLAIEKMVCATRAVPIVVAIDHGGPSRLSELSPFPVQQQEGHLDLLLDWLTQSLMPRLAAELPLVGSPLGAVVGGSSLGGLAAFYTHFRHHESFGGALVMSPSFWVHDQEILRWIEAQPNPEVSRVYLDCGIREGRGAVLAQVAAMAGILATRGYGPDHLMFRPDPRGAHSETNWRRRLPRALRYFYRTNPNS
jgi:predicted alpha/beta superfamily hydrolase